MTILHRWIYKGFLQEHMRLLFKDNQKILGVKSTFVKMLYGSCEVYIPLYDIENSQFEPYAFLLKYGIFQ